MHPHSTNLLKHHPLLLSPYFLWQPFYQIIEYSSVISVHVQGKKLQCSKGPTALYTTQYTTIALRKLGRDFDFPSLLSSSSSREATDQ